MQYDVTRNVINDLWPLYTSGDASQDSRSLVDRFLSEDNDFATILRESTQLPHAMPEFRLSPDAERRLLDDAQSRARTKLLVIGGSIGLGAVILLTALIGLLFVYSSGS